MEAPFSEPILRDSGLPPARPRKIKGSKGDFSREGEVWLRPFGNTLCLGLNAPLSP